MATGSSAKVKPHIRLHVKAIKRKALQPPHVYKASAVRFSYYAEVFPEGRGTPNSQMTFQGYLNSCSVFIACRVILR